MTGMSLKKRAPFHNDAPSHETLTNSHGHPMQEVTPKAVAIADSAATITLITIFQISFFVSSMAY